MYLDWLTDLSQQYCRLPVEWQWLLFFLGLVLLLSPSAGANLMARNKFPQYRCAVTSAAFGACAIPIGFWMYAQTFTDGTRAALFGLPGELFLMVHWLPFLRVQPFASAFIFPLALLDTPASFALVAGVTTIFWSTAYGFLGYLLDRRRNCKG